MVQQPPEFSLENGHRVLWLGGTEGLLRLDYDSLKPVSTPTTPFILPDVQQSSTPVQTGSQTFPFRDHPGELPLPSHRRLFAQQGLAPANPGLARDGGGSSLPPSALRTYEFANLSEGSYRFESRAITGAGLVSEPAIFTFQILPPWYRSNGAYFAYVFALTVGVWGLIRFRERQIRAQNERLEKLVGGPHQRPRPRQRREG